MYMHKEKERSPQMANIQKLLGEQKMINDEGAELNFKLLAHKERTDSGRSRQH